MPGIYRHQFTVRPSDLDELGHVNNVEYLRWMQEAAVAHSDNVGWTAERYREVGTAWVVRSHTITYKWPAFTGEKILILTWVADFRRALSLRKYRIMRSDDGRELAIAQTNWAFVDSATGRPRRIPPELADAFGVVAAEEEPRSNDQLPP